MAFTADLHTLLLLSIALCVATIEKEPVYGTNTVYWMESIQLVSDFLCLNILSTLEYLLSPGTSAHLFL